MVTAHGIGQFACACSFAGWSLSDRMAVRSERPHFCQRRTTLGHLFWILSPLCDGESGIDSKGFTKSPPQPEWIKQVSMLQPCGHVVRMGVCRDLEPRLCRCLHSAGVWRKLGIEAFRPIGCKGLDSGSRFSRLRGTARAGCLLAF